MRGDANQFVGHPNRAISPGAIAYAGYGPLMRLVMDLADAAPTRSSSTSTTVREPAIVAQAIEDGFNSVMFDGSRLAFDDNVEATCRLVARARRDAGIALRRSSG